MTDIYTLARYDQYEVERMFAATAIQFPLYTFEVAGWLPPDLILSTSVRKFWEILKDGLHTSMTDDQANCVVTQARLDSKIDKEIPIEMMDDTRITQMPQVLANEISRKHFVTAVGSRLGKLYTAIQSSDDYEIRRIIGEINEHVPISSSDGTGTTAADELFQKVVLAGNRSISTYIPSLDKSIGGIERQTEMVIAARPSMGKCLGKGTKVLMISGRLKAVEDVRVGDFLMGADSRPREVLSITRGREMMYWVKQEHGINYRVNESHILSLKRSKNEYLQKHGDVLNISVRDWIKRGKYLHSRYKGYKVAIDFAEQPLPIDPYLLGIWLGDGNTANSRVTTTDMEVVEYLQRYADDNGYKLKEYIYKNKAPVYTVVGRRNGWGNKDGDSLQAKLRELGVLGDKHIPSRYLYNSKQNRLKLLAGLIDSDGYYQQPQNGPYEITQKDEELARDIKFLCDSLGYRTSFTERSAQAQTGEPITVYRIRFNGNVDEIPVLVERKRATVWHDFRDWTVTAIKVEQDKIDDYYGFELSGDGLFLLEDMTVTHNTALMWQIARNVAESGLKVAFYSLEMSTTSLWARAACPQAGVMWRDVKAGSITDAQRVGLFAASGKLRDRLAGKLFVDDRRQTTETVWRDCVGIHPDLVMIDHLRLMKDPGENENKRQGKITEIMKDMAKALNCAVVIAVQLNRGVEERQDKVPVLSDLRDCGEIEENTDVAAMIYRPDYYDPPVIPTNRHYTEVWIRKNRDGVMNVLVKLIYDTGFQWFEPVDDRRTGPMV